MKKFIVYVRDEELAKRIIEDQKENERSETAQFTFMAKKYFENKDKKK